MLANSKPQKIQLKKLSSYK